MTDIVVNIYADRTPDPEQEPDSQRLGFAAVVDFFKSYNHLAESRDSMLFFDCCELAALPPAGIRAITALVLDASQELTLREAIEIWCGYECLFYSTYRNRKGRERFNIVVPLAQAMTREEFILRRRQMSSYFRCDPELFQIDQRYELPSYSAVNQRDSFIHHHKNPTGRLLPRFDPSIFAQDAAAELVAATQRTRFIRNWVEPGRLTPPPAVHANKNKGVK